MAKLQFLLPLFERQRQRGGKERDRGVEKGNGAHMLLQRQQKGYHFQYSNLFMQTNTYSSPTGTNIQFSLSRTINEKCFFELAVMECF